MGLAHLQKSKSRLLIRLAGGLLSVAGMGLVAVSLAWDAIRGEKIPHFGTSQLLGCIVGTMVLAFGGWLFTAERTVERLWPALRGTWPMTWRWLLALIFAGLATVLAMFLPRAQLFAAASWMFWSYAAAVCLLLPARFGRLVFLVTASLGAMLTAISTVKVSLTAMPLTMLDVTIATSDPAGLWDALHLPAWTRYAAITVLISAALLLLSSFVKTTIHVARAESSRHLWSGIASRFAGILLIGILAAGSAARLFDELGSYKETWDLTGITAMAAEIGVFPYLAYSSRLESSQTGEFFNSAVGAESPTEGEVREAILRHVDFKGPSTQVAAVPPNVVIVLAESTFDPNAAFRLNQTVSSTLFTAGPQTAAVGSLRVNVIGGGSWVTEFETLTGLDSRLFGYSGYYTHASLSPYVQHDLAMYFKAKGYHATAFFPHDGDFYNYRRAYQAYGFDSISDSRDRGRSDGWRGTDVQVVEDFTNVMGRDPKAPFLSYVLLIENHGPHACEIRESDDIPVRFVGVDNSEFNCSLHEYLRRLRSTEAAVKLLTDYLLELEQRTGRPYVLLVFGDHQPYSFTATSTDGEDFDQFRTGVAKNMTFFHMWSSTRNRLKCCLNEIPSTLLPTLVSALVAEGPDEVYLGMNLWLYERCGSNAVGSRQLEEISMRDSLSLPRDRMTSDVRTPACRAAYARALTGFRRAGVIRFGPDS